LIESKRGDPMPFIEAALRHEPGNGAALSLAERLLIERDDTAALAQLHRDELLAPCVRVEDFARRSYRLLALKRDAEARDAAEAGLQIDPQNPELRFNSAAASLRLGDEARAALDFARVEATSAPIYGEAMRLHAGLLLKNGDKAAASTALKARLAALPNDATVVLESAQMLLGSGARAEACALLEEHVALDARIGLELTGLLLADGDFAGAGRVAAASLT
jgi:hypothetical protein